MVICLIAARRRVRIGNILCRLPRGYGVNTLSKSRPLTPAISGGLKNKQELGLKMGTIWSGGHKSGEEIEMALSKVKEVVSSNPVVVFRFSFVNFFLPILGNCVSDPFSSILCLLIFVVIISYSSY